MTSLRKHELRETRSSDMNTGVLRLYCIDYWQSPYGASVKFMAGSRMWVRHALEQCCAAHYMSGCLKGMQGLRDNSLFFRSCLSRRKTGSFLPSPKQRLCSALFCRCVSRPAALESEPQEAVAAAKAEGPEVQGLWVPGSRGLEV